MSHGQGLWERGLADRRPTMPVATCGQRNGDLEAGRSGLKAPRLDWAFAPVTILGFTGFAITRKTQTRCQDKRQAGTYPSGRERTH